MGTRDRLRDHRRIFLQVAGEVSIEGIPRSTSSLREHLRAEFLCPEKLRESVLLGGGRRKAGDSIDFAVGFSQIKKVGERVAKNEPLFMIHARNEDSYSSVRPLLAKAVEIA